MADTPGHGSAAPHDDHDDHDAAHHDEAPEEDAVRTPLWLTLVGLALLLLGALGSYLFVYPGRMSASSSADDAGAGDASQAADAAAPTAVPTGGGGAQPAPGARPGGGGLQIVPQIVEPTRRP